MLLAIDVGNTETKFGCFATEGDELLRSWRITTDARRTPDEIGAVVTQLFETAQLRAADVEHVVIASVVPRLDYALARACRTYLDCDPVFFTAQTQTLMPVRTDRPGEVGADLVAAALGGRDRYGAPLIVASYGTATVFIAIDAGGGYCGVAIAPGISTSVDALVGLTAKLPQVALDAPAHAIGTDTVSALQSGIVYGFVGQTEAIVSRMRAELGSDAKVVATGGLAGVVAAHTTAVSEVNQHLSLLGLRLFHRSLE